MVQAPFEDILNILREGAIPVVKLDSQRLEASKVEYGLPYVVATHVWAGGLGNPKGNAMWLCQLQEMSRLTTLSQKSIRRFESDLKPERVFPTLWETIVDPLRWVPRPPPSWYWVDTLNTPRIDEDAVTADYRDRIMDFRILAIDRMTQTYAAADSAIVLEPELRQLDLKWYQRPSDSDDHEADETLLQILSILLVSTWMTRCWTYQEGTMAKELLVKLCHDDLFPMRLARRDILARNRRRLACGQYSAIHEMLDETSSWFSQLPATRKDDESVGRKEIAKGDPEVFTRIWNAVAVRSTTYAIDRLAILALLVDLRPSEVRKKGPRDGLKAILKAQEELPLALLFQPPLVDGVHSGSAEDPEIHDGDDTYPLPTNIGSEPLPEQLGWMRRNPRYLYFNNELLGAGRFRPGLFKLHNLQGVSGRQIRLCNDFESCVFSMAFGFVSERRRQRIGEGSDLYLLTSSEARPQDAFRLVDTTFFGILLEELYPHHILVEDNLPQARLFRYIHHVSCTSFEAHITAPMRNSSHPTFIERQPLVDGWEYRITCDFGDTEAPSSHRIRGVIPEWITAFDILSTIMPILVFYYLVCFGFCCIAGFAHQPGSFPKGWLAMIAFFFAFRWLFFTWNNHREYTKAVNSINFNDWVNGIGGEAAGGHNPIIDSDRVHTGFNVNMNLRETIVLALLCSIFIIAGAAKYENTNCRWLIAVGGSGLGELLLRWILELCLPTSIFWGPLTHAGQPEHPALRRAYLSPSRLTVWLKANIRG
ncbi:hypothetical protein G7Y79_00014g037090 [Physcia stellaris]|nr:hypothetical protein G7Y79_00014g037090 [Physcia stellaris]